LLKEDLHNFCPGWSQTPIILISTSQVAGITDVSHHTWACPWTPSPHFVPFALYSAAAPTAFQIACRVQGRVSERGEFCPHGNVDGALLESDGLMEIKVSLGASDAEFGNRLTVVPWYL
jgi:hypothetical protein